MVITLFIPDGPGLFSSNFGNMKHNGYQNLGTRFGEFPGNLGGFNKNLGKMPYRFFD